MVLKIVSNNLDHPINHFRFRNNYFRFLSDDLCDQKWLLSRNVAKSHVVFIIISPDPKQFWIYLDLNFGNCRIFEPREWKFILNSPDCQNSKFIWYDTHLRRLSNSPDSISLSSFARKLTKKNVLICRNTSWFDQPDYPWSSQKYSGILKFYMALSPKTR